MIKALLLDGSAASPSRVAVLLESIAGSLRKGGCEVRTIELSHFDLPVNNPDFHANPQDHPDAVVRRFVNLVKESDIIVLGTPLYHGSYSGLLKMALDHLCDDAFAGKSVGLVSNANGPRNSVQAAQELVLVARTMKGIVCDGMIGTYHGDYGMNDGTFQVTDHEILQRIELLTAELLQATA